MTLAISQEHLDLAASVRALVAAERPRDAIRACYQSGGCADDVRLWTRYRELRFPGLHLDEDCGGEGFSLAESAVVLEQLGRALAGVDLAMSIAVSAALARHGRGSTLESIASGARTVGLGLSPTIDVDGDRWSGSTGPVVNGVGADLIALVVGNDLLLLDQPGAVECKVSDDALDPSIRLGCNDINVPAMSVERYAGAGATVRVAAFIAVAALAVGGAQEALSSTLDHAKTREQFGRPIGSFQAIKHHLADMFVAGERGVAAVWDAARQAPDSTQRDLCAEVAVHEAITAYISIAQLSIQIHGGIGFTWEHDAHLHLRRARALAALIAPSDVLLDHIFEWAKDGGRRHYSLALPPKAAEYRARAREFRSHFETLAGDAQRRFWADSGYMFPHYPRPYGLSADPVEQLVVEEELGDLTLPAMGIPWILLTLIQHARPDQVSRWVPATLYGEHRWCQLFSEPGAGSDAAAISTRGTQVPGGWRITGQKVWTSGAQQATRGLITVRTDTSASKHRGITVMVVDMSAEGVDVRALREMSGDALFNEVFLEEVFVPDSDIVGEVNSGWSVARATLGNERIAIGNDNHADYTVSDLLDLIERADAGSDSWTTRQAADLVAEAQTMRLLNLRRAERAVAGAGPGAEGSVGKLIAGEHSQRVTELAMTVAGRRGVDGSESRLAYDYLFARCYTIAGGTSEVTRNVIAERILGMPREP